MQNSWFVTSGESLKSCRVLIEPWDVHVSMHMVWIFRFLHHHHHHHHRDCSSPHKLQRARCVPVCRWVSQSVKGCVWGHILLLPATVGKQIWGSVNHPRENVELRFSLGEVGQKYGLTQPRFTSARNADLWNKSNWKLVNYIFTQPWTTLSVVPFLCFV